jgi:hypothetical protein
MLDKVNVADPLFVSVTVWAAAVVPMLVDGKERELADKVARGTAPAPLRATVCGEPVAESATLRVPVTDPAAAGVKLTAIEQFAPAARVVEQVLVCEKPLFPVRLTPMPVRGAVPGFESVTVLLPDAAPNGALKDKEVGERTACAAGTGAAPLPLTEMVCVDPAVPPELSVRIRFAV